MEQHDIYVGIDVAKARVDVAIRPGGDTSEVSNDEAGIATLVAQMQQPQSRAGGLGRTGTALGGSLGSCFLAGGGSQPSTRCGTLPRPLGGWPRPIPWMRRS